MVFRPGLEHVDRLVSVAVEAMGEDQVYRYVFPNDQTRVADLETLQRDALSYLMLMGTGIVWATDALDAYVTVHRVPLPFRTEPGGPVFLDTGARDRWEKVYLEHSRRYRMPPGLLLSVFGELPESQRAGIETTLLGEVHDLADFHGVPVTTGTSDPDAVQWLIQSGYVVKADITELDHGPRIWFLQRSPVR
jgi:hypothetical protein